MKNWFLAMLLTVAFLGPTLPAQANGKNCTFRAGGLSVHFDLDPSKIDEPAESQILGPTYASEVGDCAPGQSMKIEIVGGATHYLKNGAGDLIRYTLQGFITDPPGQSNNGGYVKFLTPSASASIAWSDYANAPAGTDYTDRVTITVTP